MGNGVKWALVLLPLLAVSAEAADPSLPQAVADVPEDSSLPPGWALQVTPYLWAAGLKGDISPFRRGPTISVEKSVSDVMDHLNVGGFLDIWGRYDRLVFSGDVMYVNTTDSHVIGALPVIGATPGLSADVDTVQFSATLKGGYRVYDDQDLTLDVLAGMRIWHISNDVTVNYGTFSRSYGEDFGWVDPVIGFRAFYKVTPKFSVHAQADIGGFGAGSDHTWQALATANYAFTDHLSVSAGYKILDVDYDSDGHVFDSTLKGPILGLTYRF